MYVKYYTVSYESSSVGGTLGEAQSAADARLQTFLNPGVVIAVVVLAERSRNGSEKNLLKGAPVSRLGS